MKTPGTMLRETREVRGLTLADAAAMTRIPKNMLEHLERDRFEEYNAEVFARGHLRNYARELQLDPETVLQSYERFIGKRSADEAVEEKRGLNLRPNAQRARTTSKPRSGVSAGIMSQIRPTHMVAVVLVVFGLFVVVSILTGGRATAQDPVTFPEAGEQAWELEQDVEQTRWLLERPAPTGAPAQE